MRGAKYCVVNFRVTPFFFSSANREKEKKKEIKINFSSIIKAIKINHT